MTEPCCKKCGKPLQTGSVWDDMASGMPGAEDLREEAGERESGRNALEALFTPDAANDQEYCLDCEERDSSFLYGHSLFVYDSRMQGSMARFKYRQRKEYARYYAAEMVRVYGAWIRSLHPDAMIPVPIHAKRMRKRGFNQAQELAERISRICGVPVLDDWLLRCRNTLPQKELSRTERKVNLQGAFTLAKQLNQTPECVIIIDDIYTTGSTIEACSAVLKEAGVQRIYFLCICTGKGY